MFSAALFTVARIREQPQCPSADERMREAWCISTVEDCSAVEKSGILPLQPHAWTRRALSEKDRHCVISLVWNLKRTNSKTETNS